MNALSLLKYLCDPDSPRTYLQAPGIGCTVDGRSMVVASNGYLMLAVHSTLFDSLQGVPRIFTDVEVGRLQSILRHYQPDARAMVCDVGDLVRWCGPPHYPTECEFCDWPTDRGGIILDMPMDRVQIANLLHVAYWLTQPTTVSIRRCTHTKDDGVQAGDVLWLNAVGRHGEFVGGIMPLEPKSEGDHTDDWPVFTGE